MLKHFKLSFISYSLAVSLLMAFSSTALAQPKIPKLVLAGPFSSVSNPLIHIVETGALNDLAEKVEFVSWRDPDHLRMLALNGKTQVLAMPVNVAANLYNRGAPVKLLNVSTWGLLWLVSRDSNLTSIEDFRNKEIAMPFRGDMPDIIFGLLAENADMQLQKDIKLRYVASPLDAMQLLLMRRVDHALLAEPAVSMALRKSGSFPISVIAPELHRSLDLQEAWGKSFNRQGRIAQAGITLVGEAGNNSLLANRLAEEYEKSLTWCAENSVECGQLVAKKVPMLSPEAVSDAMAVSQMKAITAIDAREEVEFLLKQLLDRNPASVGGKLPDDNFYWQQP